MEDTICAIATTVGQSSVNIIRISGMDSIEIANKICDIDLINKKSNTISYAHIIDNNEIIDEVLISVFVAPKTFTRENVVEINSHGGNICVNKILELLLCNGCRLAEPGEFLKRAYLNGRIDLTQAESISDLITAKTEQVRKIAIKGVNKELNKTINKLRKQIVSLIGNIEVNIDYPEYEDAEIVTKEKISKVLSGVFSEIKKLVDDSDKGLIIKNGLNVAIVGKPNAGKSSLLNAILNKDKAIVTDIKGTTRDVVEDQITIDGFLINFLDTAGIRETNDVVEKIGVKRSIDTINNADLILFVVDSEKFEKEDYEILEKIKNKNVLVIYNKIDKNNNEFNELNKYDSVKVSALNKENIEILKEKIIKIFKLNEINYDYTYISNSRQIALLKKCRKISQNIESAINGDLPIDMIEIDVKELWETLGEITGEVYKDELLDEIFSKFCLGKW